MAFEAPPVPLSFPRCINVHISCVPGRGATREQGEGDVDRGLWQRERVRVRQAEH